MSVQATNDSWARRIGTGVVRLGPDTQSISEQIAVYEESQPSDKCPEFPFHVETYISISLFAILHKRWSFNLPSCTAVTISCGVVMPEWSRYFVW